KQGANGDARDADGHRDSKQGANGDARDADGHRDSKQDSRDANGRVDRTAR
nr:hypothetical protein [Solirubrobacterales bacterium]